MSLRRYWVTAQGCMTDKPVSHGLGPIEPPYYKAADVVGVYRPLLERVVARIEVHIGNKNISDVSDVDCILYEDAQRLLKEMEG